MDEIETVSKKVAEKSKKKKKKRSKETEETVDPSSLPPIEPRPKVRKKKKSKDNDEDNKPFIEEQDVIRDAVLFEEENEKLQIDNEEKPKKKKKKKKKADPLAVENEELEQKLAERERRRKRRSSTKEAKIKGADGEERLEDRIRDPALALALRDLQDDMHSVESAGSLRPLPSPVRPVLPVSHHVDKVFTERLSGGFAHSAKKSQEKNNKSIKLTSVNPSTTAEQLKPRKTPLELGMDTQRAFRSFGVFCHGFLAGMAFWQLIMIVVLSHGQKDILDFIALYSPLSQPLQCIFYFLAVICTISILDRYDFALLDWRQLQLLLTLRSGGLAVLVYAATLMLNMGTARLDDKMSLYRINSTIFELMEPEDLAYEFQTWRTLNFCRSIGFILGWILVSLRPSTDQLHKHLRRLGNVRSKSEVAVANGGGK